MKELTEEQFEELKSHSRMLGVIGAYVDDFCSEEDTVLMGVIRLLASYHTLKSCEMFNKLDDLREQNEKL